MEMMCERNADKNKNLVVESELIGENDEELVANDRDCSIESANFDLDNLSLDRDFFLSSPFLRSLLSLDFLDLLGDDNSGEKLPTDSVSLNVNDLFFWLSSLICINDPDLFEDNILGSSVCWINDLDFKCSNGDMCCLGILSSALLSDGDESIYVLRFGFVEISISLIGI
ncbi:hypothetical protein DERP_000384 [Dermatophagoides pteronyssinus]|uniref:Uncharacterized protein n=1 Tax=Dermatophagoides pteronyssinus TaxID=6956 RepID=A0ABQ8J0K2_DERPT|nr:hypothetical protein DERP_000384 [Dermatophagoides pteronyssinus]